MEKAEGGSNLEDFGLDKEKMMVEFPIKDVDPRTGIVVGFKSEEERKRWRESNSDRDSR